MKLLNLIFVAGVLVLAAGTASAEIENGDCLDCHDVAAGEIAGAYDEALAFSIHEGMSCVDCHVSITDLPHEDKPASVTCGDCHEQESDDYKWHGMMSRDECDDIPCCSDCHGKHDILPSDNKASRVNSLNLPETCGKCHENLDLTEKYEILIGREVEVYQNSIHGKAALGGVYTAATCVDCHSPEGSSHRILNAGNPESATNHFNIPNTCGNCHRGIAGDYWEGIHGKSVANGETSAPVCTNCHGEHGIMAATDPRSPVSPNRIAQATCEPCHESAYINEKFGISSRKVETWVDSYHGLKSSSGDITVANCASCHGAHRILPQSDQRSLIHPIHLKETCGNCHPGITDAMASTPIHKTPGEARSPIAGVIANLYLIMIFVVIGGMILHWIIDYRRQLSLVNRGPQVVRMDNNAIAQHTLLMGSFIVLVITGFSLRFSEAFWVIWLFGWEGGFPLRGTLHRWAAVVMIVSSLWHLLFLTTRKGHRFLRDIVPGMADMKDVIGMLKYNLALSRKRPQFARFSYVEKAEYWALVWGTALMAGTGLFLWFDNMAMTIFPKWVLDVLLVVHYYEAWLAMLAILVWHMYSTILSPGVYPMNPAWYTGKMPLKMYEHEHPGAPLPVVNANDEIVALDDQDKRETSTPKSKKETETNG